MPKRDEKLLAFHWNAKPHDSKKDNTKWKKDHK